MTHPDTSKKDEAPVAIPPAKGAATNKKTEPRTNEDKNNMYSLLLGI